MGVSVSDVLARADTLLLDAARVRWPVAERLMWIADGAREVLVHRPEAGTVMETIALVPNEARQALPPGCLRLVEILRNVGGAPVTAVDRQAMDLHRPGWYEERPAAAIRHFCVDARDPRAFWVWPRPNDAVCVEAIVVAEPPASLGAGGVLQLDSIFTGAIVDYLAYRAFSKDAEDAFNAQRAIAHYQAFADAVGLTRTNEPVVLPMPGGA